MEDNTSALGVFQLTESPAGFPTHPQLNIGQQVIVLLPFFTMMALCLPLVVLNVYFCLCMQMQIGWHVLCIFDEIT